MLFKQLFDNEILILLRHNFHHIRHLYTISFSNLSIYKKYSFLYTCCKLNMFWHTYLSNQIQAKVILNVSSKTLREIAYHFTLIHTTHCCPSLTLIVSYSLSESLREVPPPHPPLYVSHFQLHSLFLWRCRMQKHLHIHTTQV